MSVLALQPPTRSPSFRSLSPLPWLLALGMIGVTVVAYQGFCHVPLLLDEKPHYARILAIRQGTIDQVKHACCPHTYHHFLALTGSIAGAHAPHELRLVSLLVSLLCVPLAFAVVRKLDPEGAPLAAAQFFFLPVLLPFFFLLYTDPLGLLFALLTLLLVLHDCLWAAALASIASVCVRQTHVVWMLFAFLLPYVRKHGWRLERDAVVEHLRRGWLFLLGFAGFTVFVVLNKGVSLGDRQAHPTFEFRPGNVFFALFVVFVVFLPLHVANLPRIVELVRRRPWWLLVVAGALLLFLFGTHFDHPYNQWDRLLRNKILRYVGSNALYGAIFFGTVALALLSLAATQLKEASFFLLYPMAILHLAPSWLIDPRYSIPALAMFVLCRARSSWLVEGANLAWSALLSLFILDGTIRQAFFL